MTTFIRSQRQRVAWAMIVIFLVNTFSPITSYALTSGPSQPEHQGFQPAGTTDMVDLFSGDFSYNIPLFELPGPNGGYPFNLSYQAGITMDQEASWAGLGWTLSPGAINRQMRGLPDDFKWTEANIDVDKKDRVTTTMAIEPSVTAGLTGGSAVEVLGAGKEVGSAGLSIHFNSYKGFGYSIDATAGFAQSVRSGGTQGIRFGANISLGSEEGATIAPSLHLGGKLGEFGLTAPYSSMSGMQNLVFTQSKNISFKGYNSSDKATRTEKTSGKVRGMSSFSLLLANPGYTPQVTMPMRNYSLRAEFNPGAGATGVFKKLYMSGYYTEQRLKDDLTIITSPAYGYMNYDSGQLKSTAMLDFNREKDGMVSKETPNLGIPSLTYDIYSVTGQGVGSMYRPIRNDFGIVHDAEMVSESVGGAIGVDVGPDLSHSGVNLSVNHSRSASGAWTEDNGMIDNAKFQSQKTNDTYEPWNFKVHGELTGEKKSNLDLLGGTQAVRVKLGGDPDGNPAATTRLENKTTGWDQPLPQLDRSRKQRNEVIQAYTNEQILKDGDEVINFFQDKYYTSNVTFLNNENLAIALDRSNFPKNHIAGFTALTASSLRYNYTIPIYNSVQEEVMFSTNRSNMSADSTIVKANEGTGDNPVYSADNTEKFLKKTATSAYATSYLLTSIVGPDYVDVDNNGVSRDDLGYWVKFTYYKATSTSQQYKWREPYDSAHFVDGWRSSVRDDKASYTYGEKDLWYLATAETKTHVANFQTAPRLDGVGVTSRFPQATDDPAMTLLKLHWIGLYSRDVLDNAALHNDPDPYAIKKVCFTHKYLLCKGTPNSTGTDPTGNKGKLTLTKLVFRYGNSTRGDLNPYLFTYNDQGENGRRYDRRKYDRWGAYKPFPIGNYRHTRHNIDFPYADQDSANKEMIDDNAAAWSLKEIITPSGSRIIVDYETDDYAYVQHKQAMQMVPLVYPFDDPLQAAAGPSQFDLHDADEDHLDAQQIRFKLQEKIFISDVPEDDEDGQQEEVKRYLDWDDAQVAFKIAMNLRTSAEETTEEYISGYAPVDQRDRTMKLQKANVNDSFYTYGTFLLANDPTNGHHPFLSRTLQHLRTNQPELLSPDYTVSRSGNAHTMVDEIRAIGEVFKSIRSLFERFEDYCLDMHWAQEINIAKSYIRLNSVDKVKYGGGVRVKQITVDDNWNDDKEGLYGQVYDYTIEDEDSKIISSGVASNEPIMGGEENALRYAKEYTESTFLRSDNNLFFEYPVNESYYPAPHVGYRRITVTSLAAAALAGIGLNNVIRSDDPDLNLFPHDPANGITYGTTGKTVHEYYTAKEFPVIADEADKYDDPDHMSVPIPFMGNLTISKMTSTQGYSIVTNDMHGKLKKTSTYRQDSKGGFEKEPISWIQYDYSSDSAVYQRKNVYVLNNDFKLDATDNTLRFPGGNETADYTMGQENEFFLDMRQFEDIAWEGGPRINLDMIYLPFAALPLPTVWGSLGKSMTQLRTAVTNKVIFKPGVLVSVRAYDGGSLVKTQNVKWDLLTGQVVLSKVNNNFDHDVFSYKVPAYTQYKGLSGAYQNIGLRIDIASFTPVKSGDTHNYQFFSNIASGLYPGDEIIIYPYADDKPGPRPEMKVIYMGERGRGIKWVYAPEELATTDGHTGQYTGLVVRSGFRNHLDATAGTITALTDPSKRIPSAKVVPSKTLPFNP